MANYKLVNADQLDTDLKTVANAIRTKGGTSANLQFPSGFVSAVNAISTGAELNFEVVGGTTQPSNPKENTIWVNTSTTITSWVFSAEQPSSPSSGMVWISVGDSSDVAFNVLKKNAIQVYPLAAKQFVNGTFVDCTSEIYQDGEWKQFSEARIYYYNKGDNVASFQKYLQNSNTASITFGSDKITFTSNSDTDPVKSIYTTSKVDVSKLSTLHCVMDITKMPLPSDAPLYFGLASSKLQGSWTEGAHDPSNYKAYARHASTGSNLDIKLDVSKITGTYYVVVNLTYFSGTIYEIYGE